MLSTGAPSHPLVRLFFRTAILLFALSAGSARAAIPEIEHALEKKDYALAASIATPLAEHGVAEAQYTLGILYWRGQGVPKNLQTAYQWLEKADRKYTPRAAFVARVIKGELRSSNESKKVDRSGFPLKRLASDDDYEASEQSTIADFYIEGFSIDGKLTPQNLEKAIYWATKSAKNGYSSAQYELAVMLEQGIGADKSLSHAFAWYLKAAEQSHPEAAEILSSLYANGQGTEKNREKSRYWLWKAATVGRRPYACYQLGLLYATGQEFEKNEAKAFELFDFAKRMGITEATLMVANAYANGKGVTENMTVAIHWYTNAANEGNSEAQFMLGLIYSAGRGVLKDDSLAATWFHKAAQNGHAKAQYRIGVAYAGGRGVPKNSVVALSWLTLAAQNGQDAAQGEIARIARSVPAKAQEQAKAMAADWKPGHAFNSDFVDQ